MRPGEEELKFSDGSGEGPPDDVSNVVHVTAHTMEADKVWVNVVTMDEECSWFFNRENWEQFKQLIERRLGG